MLMDPFGVMTGASMDPFEESAPRLVSKSRGVGPDDIPDGPVWHHAWCALRPLHLGDCRVARPHFPPGPTLGLDQTVTEMAPTKETDR